MLKIASQSDVFTKEKLKERKQALGNVTDWDEYMKNTHELNALDFAKIEALKCEAEILWKDIKDIRNKILAHQDILNENKKNNILAKGKYEIFEKIISKLLTIRYILDAAYINGTKPDFAHKDIDIHSSIKTDIESLFSRLSGSQK